MIADVSHWRPVVDWGAVSAKYDFLISKATQGITYIDSTLNSFIAGCENHEVPYWLYAYLRNGNEVAQVDHLHNVCADKVGRMFQGYVLDIEEYNAEDNVIAALERLKNYSGKCMIYTMYSQYSRYANLIKNRGDNVAWWEARYGANTGTYNPKYPAHKGVDLHQYTSKGVAPGIGNAIDMNRVTGEGKSLEWFSGKEKDEPQNPGTRKNKNGLAYAAHVQTYGDLDAVQDGQTAGTVEQAKRLEGLFLDFREVEKKLNCKLKVDVCVNIQSIGQVEYNDINNRTRIGTMGLEKALESIIIKCDGLPEGYTIFYELYVQKYGWLGAVQNGQCAGSQGMKIRAEAFRAWVDEV